MSANLPCYHGSICRADAESILEKIKVTGAFLIRNSETFIGSYTLCLWADNGYHQYRIINDGDGVFVKAEAGVEETKYPSLLHLIEYYQNQNSANGLAAPLKMPVPVEPSETVYDLKKSTEVKEILACYFQHKFRYERHSRFNSTFYYLVEKYLESGLISDLKNVQNSEIRPKEIPHFRKLIFDSMKILFESVNDVFEKLNFLNSFFSNTEEDRNFKLNLDGSHSTRLVEDLESLMNLPSFLRTIESNIISHFNNRLFNSKNNQISCINGLNTYNHAPMGISHINSYASSETLNMSPASSIKTFEIEFSNTQSSMLQIMCKASVDILMGKVKFELLHTKTKSVLKPIIFDCDSIKNISKIDNNSQRLLIKEASFNDYLSIDFTDERSRDEFISCVCAAKRYQDMKTNKPVDCLSIFIGSWNVGASKTLENFSYWFKCEGSGNPLLSNIGQHVPHDLYIVAFQEGSSEPHLDAIISSALNANFKQDFPLISSKSNSFPKTLKLSIFCRSSLEKYFRNVSIDVVNTGFANKCGNKGAVSISFHFNDALFCFINCHLASGVHNVKRREEEFKIIIQKINTQRKRSGCADLISKYDFVFCMGDFNMRTDLHVTEAMRLLQCQQTSELFKTDELLKYQKSKYANCFKIFKEPSISHGPTYRYLKGTRDNLDPFKQKIGTADKINSPSWCDRVLYKARNNNSILPISYGINLDYKSSDHKPVFSSFLVTLPPRDYIENSLSKSPLSLRIDEILVQINNQGKLKQQFHIQIESALLADIYLSNTPHAICETSDTRIYVASQSKLKDMIPILDLNKKSALLFINPFKQISLKNGVSRRDIENGFLFISLISSDKSECLGSCSIPMKRLLTPQVITIEDNLFEHMVPVGSLIIRANVDSKFSDQEISTGSSNPSIIAWHQNSYSTEETTPNFRNLIDFINDLDSDISDSNRTSVVASNMDELSAFRTIQADGNSLHSVRQMTARPNNFGEMYHSHLSKVNGINFSSSMRITKNKDSFDYSKERQNFSDESCNGSKFSCHTVCKSKLCNYRFEHDEDTTIRKHNISDDTALTTVHNEGYSTAIIRGGVSNKKRNMDARVDLSKLESDMNNIQPPLPPRSGRKNVRPTKTRQEHSNPISMASSSGSSYNANSIGDSSVASAGASCCLLNPDSEFEDATNDAMLRKFSQQQTPYTLGQVSLDELKKSIRTDNSSKQSTITGSNNQICSLSGQYVQAVSAVTTEDTRNREDRLIEPYASTKITEDFAEPDARKLSNEIEYVMLQRPLEIKEWLIDLGIPQKYVSKLMSSCYNNIDSIIRAKDDDLKSAGVSELSYRRRILEGITTLRNEKIAQ